MLVTQTSTCCTFIVPTGSLSKSPSRQPAPLAPQRAFTKLGWISRLDIFVRANINSAWHRAGCGFFFFGGGRAWVGGGGGGGGGTGVADLPREEMVYVFPFPPSISFHLRARYTQQQAFLESLSEFGTDEAAGI